MNSAQIGGSPFQVFAKIHPTQLGEQVRVVEGVSYPWGVAVNSKQQLVVAEDRKNIMVFDKSGKKAQTITRENCSRLHGVTVDKMAISMSLTWVFPHFLSSARKEKLLDEKAHNQESLGI